MAGSTCQKAAMKTATAGSLLVTAVALGWGCRGDFEAGPGTGGSDGGTTPSDTSGSGTDTSSVPPGTSGTTTHGSDDSGGTLSTGGSGSSGDGIPQPDLWYSFDGHVHDEIGDADGVEVGALSYQTGYDGLAGVFGEEGVYVDASAFGGVYRASRDSISVAIRLRPESYPQIMNLVSLGGSGDDITTNAQNLVIHEGAVKLFTEIDAAGTDSWAMLGDAPTPDEWHGLVVVVDDGTARMFLDGEAGEAVAYLSSVTESETLSVGAFAAANVFHGLIDDLGIYLEVLPQDVATELSSL